MSKCIKSEVQRSAHLIAILVSLNCFAAHVSGICRVLMCGIIWNSYHIQDVFYQEGEAAWRIHLESLGGCSFYL